MYYRYALVVFDKCTRHCRLANGHDVTIEHYDVTLCHDRMPNTVTYGRVTDLR